MSLKVSFQIQLALFRADDILDRSVLRVSLELKVEGRMVCGAMVLG